MTAALTQQHSTSTSRMPVLIFPMPIIALCPHQCTAARPNGGAGSRVRGHAGADILGAHRSCSRCTHSYNHSPEMPALREATLGRAAGANAAALAMHAASRTVVRIDLER